MGAARRQVAAEGGAGAGESVVEVQERYNCSCRAFKHCSLRGCRSASSSACAECVAARNECSGGGQPVPRLCDHLRLVGGGQKPAECHLVALGKLRQNDFSTPYHANIKIRLRLSFALLQVIEGGLEKEGANMFTLNMPISF